VLKTHCVWAGIARVITDGTTTDQECRLEPGDRVLLHTDGATEAANGNREMFGLERLRRTFERERAAGRGVDEISDHIMSEVRGFMVRAGRRPDAGRVAVHVTTKLRLS